MFQVPVFFTIQLYYYYQFTKHHCLIIFYNLNYSFQMQSCPFLNINSLRQANISPKISTIKPDKFTYLYSNLMIPNILYGKHNKNRPASINTHSKDAYILCQQSTTAFQENRIQAEQNVQEKIASAQAMLRLHCINIAQAKAEQYQAAKEIMKMNQNIRDKAEAIMSGKDQAQFARNKSLQIPAMLKNIKQKGRSALINKLELTRKCMKNFGKTIQINVQNIVSPMKQCQNISITGSLNASDSSCTSTSLSNSNDDQEKNQKKYKIIYEKIKAKGYKSVQMQQRRRAAWNGFLQFEKENIYFKKDEKKNHQKQKSPKKITKKNLVKEVKQRIKRKAPLNTTKAPIIQNSPKGFKQIINDYKLQERVKAK